MRKYLLAAVAAAAIASPAAARDGAGYVGLEGGIVVGADTDFDIEVDGVEYDDALQFEYKSGYDLDVIGGYDFGNFRAEAELGYKRLKIDTLTVSNEVAAEFGEDPGDVDPDDLDLDDKVTVLSGMANLLFDLGDEGRAALYAGGGLGLASVKAFDEKDGTWAWQLIAGFRIPVSYNVDIGVKYRYFNTGKLEFNDELDDASFSSDGRLSSHSLLASVVFNFGSPVVAPPPPVYVAPPPPPPPPPPATQTCPDGSVIPATDYCPPPPPPPPPPRTGERG